MKVNLLILVAVLAFAFQISFSFYYSSRIVMLNTQYNHNQKILSELNIKQQLLQSTLSKLTNSEYILSNLPGLQPINQQLP